MRKILAAALSAAMIYTSCGMPAFADPVAVTAEEETGLITSADTITGMLKTYLQEQELPFASVSASLVPGYATVRCAASSDDLPGKTAAYIAENNIDPKKVLFSFNCDGEAEKLAAVLLPYIEQSDLNLMSYGLHEMPGFFSVKCSYIDYAKVKTELNAVLTEHDLSTRRLMVICPENDPAPLTGDMDNDGNVSAMDAQLVLNYALEQVIESDTVIPAFADIDGDGETTPLDAQYVLTYFLRNNVMEDPAEWSEIVPNAPAAPLYATDTVYKNADISITLSSYYTHSTNVYMTDIQVTDAKYIKTAFANNTYGKDNLEPTSDIAKAHNAILAINGDYYSYHTYGYVVRNGVAYRDLNNGHWLGCLFNDGDFRIISSNDCRAASLVEDGCWQQFDFGPVLLNNGGEITVGVDEDVAQRLSSNPRTAFGMVEPLHYQFVVSDGRSTGNAGLSLWEVAEFMQQFGTQILYNLDGGGSSTMYFQGRIINQPVNYNRIEERVVSDIVYVG